MSGRGNSNARGERVMGLGVLLLAVQVIGTCHKSAERRSQVLPTPARRAPVYLAVQKLTESSFPRVH
jgi:hypothetical protein